MQTNNNYFIAANDQLLCDIDGNLLVFTEQELLSLKIEVLTQHLIFVDSQQQLSVLATHGNDIAGYQWLSLRSQLSLISEEQFQLAGRALQMLRWHYDHQFCGRCGQATQDHPHDLAKTCGNCAIDFYPRLSPCIITLITRGEYCLLAQHARSTNQTHSCLAGFIEIGESPEQALAREVMEEVGIQVKNIRYISSQPWPFPGQLMLGYFADYAEGNIIVDQKEILAANWFKYDQLPKIPAITSIAGRLINTFVQQQTASHITIR